MKRSAVIIDPICEQLRRRRVCAEMTREELAERLGYPADTIGRWERGNHSPSSLALQAWARSLGANVNLSE